MQYEVRFMEKLDVVVVEVQEKLNIELGKEFMAEAMNLARKHETHKFILDYRKSFSEDNITALYYAAKNPETFGVTQRDKVAIVFSREQEKYRFFESAIRNIGFNIAVFMDMEDALNWIAK